MDALKTCCLNDKSADPDQTALPGAVWSESSMIAQVLIPQYIIYENYLTPNSKMQLNYQKYLIHFGFLQIPI